MMMLRPYQLEAVKSVYNHLRTRDDNPCVVIPTGGGKTPVIASICRDAVELWGMRVLVLAHVKELLEQTADKLRAVCPEVPFGVYSAGLGRRDTDQPVIVGGIQSVYQRAEDLGKFGLVIVDECHLLPPNGEGMYRQLLADARAMNPDLRVIGFTATPYRLKSGELCTPDGILNHICYEVGVRELIRDGYLCPLVCKAGKAKADTSGLHVQGGEFAADEVEALMDDEELVQSACEEVVEATKKRNACLIFASGIEHGGHIVSVLKEKHGIDCGFITGDTPSDERDAILTRFRDGELKYLCNVNVLTTGFDAPHIDCVALLRPTMSPGLYYQQVGRGFRLHPSKANCLVLDFGGNVLRHGPVDLVKVRGCGRDGTDGGREDKDKPLAKECPNCLTLLAAAYTVCPDCGYKFPAPKPKHEAKAATIEILSGPGTVDTLKVRTVRYRVHTKRGADDSAPKSMRVEYQIGWYKWKSEWVCFEHKGFARRKAEQWWRKRSREPVPATAAEAVEIASAGRLAATESITVRSEPGKFDEIVAHKLGPIPELPEYDEPSDADDSLTIEYDDGPDFPYGFNATVTKSREEDVPW